MALHVAYLPRIGRRLNFMSALDVGRSSGIVEHLVSSASCYTPSFLGANRRSVGT